MSKDANKKLELTTSTVAPLRELILAQTRLIDHILNSIHLHQAGEHQFAKGDDEVFRIVLTMIHMAGISGHSILKLTKNIGLEVRDTYPIARAIVETVINVLFIMARGREMALRADRHAEAKTYRDLSRDWSAGTLTLKVKFGGTLAADVASRLEDLSSEFTTSKGSERNWIDDSIKQRLAAIGEVFPSSVAVSLNVAAFQVYRHSSEVLHGTYFSAMHFWGLTIPGRPRPSTSVALKEVLAEHQFTVLTALFWCYAALIESVGFYVGDLEYKKAADKLVDRFAELPLVKLSMDQNSKPSVERD
jgi:hypothetical protein